MQLLLHTTNHIYKDSYYVRAALN